MDVDMDVDVDVVSATHVCVQHKQVHTHTHVYSYKVAGTYSKCRHTHTSTHTNMRTAASSPSSHPTAPGLFNAFLPPPKLCNALKLNEGGICLCVGHVFVCVCVLCVGVDFLGVGGEVKDTWNTY